LGGGVCAALRDGRIENVTNFSPGGLKQQWRLSTEKVAELYKSGLGEANELLCKKNRTPFEETLLLALRHYSISSLKRDPAEKLLYVVSALEAVLLGGRDEGLIAQNFRERLALLRSSHYPERREVSTRAGQIYSERSKFVHGGVKPKDLQALQDFMMDAWVVMIRLLRNHHVFRDKSDFLNMLEATKMAGPPFGSVRVESKAVT